MPAGKGNGPGLDCLWEREVQPVADVEDRPARIVHDGSTDQRVLSASVIDTSSFAPSPGVSSPCFGEISPNWSDGWRENSPPTDWEELAFSPMLFSP